MQPTRLRAMAFAIAGKKYQPKGQRKMSKSRGQHNFGAPDASNGAAARLSPRSRKVYRTRQEGGREGEARDSTDGTFGSLSRRALGGLIGPPRAAGPEEWPPAAENQLLLRQLPPRLRLSLPLVLLDVDEKATRRGKGGGGGGGAAAGKGEIWTEESSPSGPGPEAWTRLVWSDWLA
ncbi:hypothetical protein AXG93_4346s1120 [Marchantia polymorpha subsp. ruderalis]|uniref:Uncharacterized protein n=1 Tax=Marchantia polymorpha subsp. ruderalis TaxID=1480154 RepID=A0A176WRW4_MARPO|nr:hypothetical protein AXG93_4346s1120 [Marchantia polymorpha subsp. ruderalis]